MNYIGEECFGCKQTFGEDDDVVVCPECGTPYHRVCYKEFGECVNHQLHESGQSWSRSSEQKSKTEESPSAPRTICPKCQGLNSSGAQNCVYCGENLTLGESESFDDKNMSEAGFFGGFGGIDMGATNQFLEEKLSDNVTVKEALHFVDSNAIYYIPIFRKMKAFGTKISFSFVCLFFPYFYFANRRMWLPAIITSILSALFSIPELLYIIGVQGASMPFMGNILTFIYDHEPFIDSLSEICGLASWVLRIVCFLFANWIYYRYTIKTIAKAKAQCGHELSPHQLKNLGGVKPLNILFIGLIIMGISLIVELGVMTLLMIFAK